MKSKAPMEDQPAKRNENELQEALTSLKHISRLTGILGFSAFTASMLALILLIYLSYLALIGLRVFAGLKVDYWEHQAAVPMALLVTFSAVSIFLIVVYDAVQKKGSVIFDEISDELHRHNAEQELKLASDARGRVSLDARVVLRTFSRATDLPLVPGRFGRTVYVIIDLAMLFGALLLTMLFIS